MKRFHVHVSVDDLDANIGFYSAVFGTAPSVLKSDYAKWMLEDPRVNFAISKRGTKPGLDHLGIQVESDAELAGLRDQVREAEIAALDQDNAACCYARSDKYWITDPQGIPWETFNTLDSIPVFGEDNRVAPPAQDASACCSPTAKAIPITIQTPATRSCCG